MSKKDDTTKISDIRYLEAAIFFADYNCCECSLAITYKLSNNIPNSILERIYSNLKNKRKGIALQIMRALEIKLRG